MTKKDTLSVFAILQTVYPSSEMWQGDVELLVKVWTQMFKSVPFQDMNTAVQNYIRSNKFAPTIADINTELRKSLASEAAMKNILWDGMLRFFDEICDLMQDFQYTLVESNGKTQGENARAKTKELYETLPCVLKQYFGSYSAMLSRVRDYEYMDNSRCSVSLSVWRTQFEKDIDNILPGLDYSQVAEISAGSNRFLLPVDKPRNGITKAQELKMLN